MRKKIYASDAEKQQAYRNRKNGVCENNVTVDPDISILELYQQGKTAEQAAAIKGSDVWDAESIQYVYDTLFAKAAKKSPKSISESTLRIAKKVMQIDPSYYDRVESGELTWHKAAVQLGIITRANISTNDIDKAIDVMLEYYNAEQILCTLINKRAFQDQDELERSWEEDEK